MVKKQSWINKLGDDGSWYRIPSLCFGFGVLSEIGVRLWLQEENEDGGMRRVGGLLVRGILNNY